MMNQILSHTPLYVWTLLAFLVSRGVAALRDREMPFRTLCIIPLVMLALSLQDVAGRFGAMPMALPAWLAGTVVASALAWRFGSVRVAPGATPATVRVRGSALPLALMLAIFTTKYASAVMLAVHPQWASAPAVVLPLCLVYGAFSGCFIGRLLRDAVARSQFAMMGFPHSSSS